MVTFGHVEVKAITMMGTNCIKCGKLLCECPYVFQSFSVCLLDAEMEISNINSTRDKSLIPKYQHRLRKIRDVMMIAYFRFLKKHGFEDEPNISKKYNFSELRFDIDDKLVLSKRLKKNEKEYRVQLRYILLELKAAIRRALNIMKEYVLM